MPRSGLQCAATPGQSLDMHTDEKKFATVAKPAAEALRSGSESIVDQLLSLPEHVAEADDAVDRAIARVVAGSEIKRRIEQGLF